MSFPLRSSRDTVGGIVLFGRILDKIRLNAEGRLPEGYHLGFIAGNRTFDDRVCRFLKVEAGNSPIFPLGKLPISHYTSGLMPQTPAINLRRGQAIRHNGDVCIISSMELKTPPRMASYVQMSVRSISSGNVHNLRPTSNDSLESVNMTKEDYEFSYKDSSGYHFLHCTTYDDVCLGDVLVKPVKDYLIEGQKYLVVMTDEIPAAIELPASMVMTVAESADGVRGDSANNVQKPATLETGLIVNVPLFINRGEKISVKTEDGTYLGRA